MKRDKTKRVELHCHTSKSRLEGLGSVDDILKIVEAQNMNVVAFTDYDNVLAWPEIQRRVEKSYRSIKPIYGVEFLVVEDILSENDTRSNVRFDGKPAYYVLVLAQNQMGVKRLYELVTKANERGNGTRPRLLWSELLKNREGLLFGSTCCVGELIHSIVKEVPDYIINKIALRYDFLELQPVSNDKWLIESEKCANIQSEDDIQNIHRKVISIGERLHIPVVATSDVFYLRHEDELSRKILVHGRGWGEDCQGEAFFRTTEEMLQEFSYLGEEKALEIVIHNSNCIADSIEYLEPISKKKIYPVIKDADISLKKLCAKAAIQKYQKDGSVPKEILKIMNQEINWIELNGYAEIYLHYHEIIQKNHLRQSQYIMKGCGASSVVSYLLDLTHIDPMGKECTLENRIFFGRDGKNQPRFNMQVDESVFSLVRKSLNELEGIDCALWETTSDTVTDVAIKSWIESYEQQYNITIDENQRKQIFRNLEYTMSNKGIRRPGKFVMIPSGSNISGLMPLDKTSDTSETVLQFELQNLDNMFCSYEIQESRYCMLLSKLEEETKCVISMKDICDEEFISKIVCDKKNRMSEEETEYFFEIIQEYQPKSFLDCVRISCLIHGTGVWLENGEILLRQGEASAHEIITNIEDVYEMLRVHGLSEADALEISEYVRHGRMVDGRYAEKYTDLMYQFGVSDWFIKSCRKIRYLFSRAHAAEHEQMKLKLIYYKHYYRETFDYLYNHAF